jgi:wobble nucleotide-excising tRNase
MIESIQISKVATYSIVPEQLAALGQFNFLYGSNGSGKTTISRLIANEGSYPSCKIVWKGGTKLEPLVYNCDFVEKNFNQSSVLKGVFTLGEKQGDALASIAAKKRELDSVNEDIVRLTHILQGPDALGGKTNELKLAEDLLKAKCWAQKQKHDAKLQGAFEGYRGVQEKFKAKILQEEKSNKAVLKTLDDLEKRAETIFGSSHSLENLVPEINMTELLVYEKSEILSKRIIGKDDVDIAAIIKKLGNSDWVKEGRGYFEINDDICPFCQQTTASTFKQSLNEYFDETFLRDMAVISDLSNNYITEAARIKSHIASILLSPSRFLKSELLSAEMAILESKITVNTLRLTEKKKESSKIIELDSLENVLKTIDGLIQAANVLTAKHNETVNNISSEKAKLTAEVWKFVLNELQIDLATYASSNDSLSKAINSLSLQIKNKNESKALIESQIRLLEKEITSVQPTIDGINALLKSFGFQGFKIAKATDDTSYRLLRVDGTDARTTLSEGEKTFVTFLYFYHLLRGSASESGITTNRIVVFDDPVSSLDSDILFIVSSLIKGLFEDLKTGKGNIKQIFVLTHNVYFHKEITFNPDRKKRGETFWVIRKLNDGSKIEQHLTNPIKTSYELLWADVRKPDKSNSSIQNTLRRILENYFKILGDTDSDAICALFDGNEKLVCKSLFSWVNDGSHSAHDDLFIALDTHTVEAYLKVFRSIFEKSKHEAHYRMMMGDAYLETNAEAVG